MLITFRKCVALTHEELKSDKTKTPPYSFNEVSDKNSACQSNFYQKSFFGKMWFYDNLYPQFESNFSGIG